MQPQKMRRSQALMNAEREKRKGGAMNQKKITRSGAVTIPRELRAKLGIAAGAPVDISAEDYAIRITKHVPSCRFCGETAGVLEVMGIELCLACAEKIMEAFQNER